MTASAPGEDELDRYIEFAQSLADTARPIAMRYFKHPMTIDAKQDRSPVTIADRDIEAALRAMIEDQFPDHGILGEELGSHQMDADLIWVLDPIDGTQSFATGKPLFGTLISLTHRQRPLIGVIDHAALDERWTGCIGRTTIYNGAEARVRECSALDQAWLYATSPEMFPADEFAAFQQLIGASRRVIYGAECYSYGLLASGHVDLVCEATLQPYDYCALVPVVIGAGGVMTDWNGQPLTIQSDGRVLAAGDAVMHARALEYLR